MVQPTPPHSIRVAGTAFSFDLGGDATDSTVINGSGDHTFANLDAGNYTLGEVVPAGWDLNGVSCTASRGSSATDANPSAITLAAGGSVECTFTNEKPVVNICPTGGSSVLPKIIGAGMGAEDYEINPQTVVVPDANELSALLAQFAGKLQGNGGYPTQVKFETPGQTETLNTPTRNAERLFAVYTFETELAPADQVKVTATVPVVNGKHSPRALVLYPTYEIGSPYYNDIALGNRQVYYAWTPSRTQTLTFPELTEVRSLYVAAAVIDNDADARPLILTISAGGVQEVINFLGPNQGDLLNIFYVKLPQVPVGTSEVQLQLRSPSSNGDSGSLVGSVVTFPCTPDTDDDGIPDVEEDYNGGGPSNDDTDNDGIPDYQDPDDDGDGVPTQDEDPNGDLNPRNDNSNNNNIPNYLDPNDTSSGAAEADLRVEKSDAQDPVTQGNTIQYTLKVTNDGPDAAQDVLLTDQLPANVAFASATPGGPTCTHTSGVVTCKLGTLAAGSDTTVVVEVTTNANTPTQVTNVANVTSSIADNNGNNNSDSETTNVFPTSGGSELIYVSSSSGGTVGGVKFGDEDILVFDPASNTWALYFDGSDVGLGAADVDAFHINPDGSIRLSLADPATVPGVGSVDDSDIVKFTPTSTGPNTAGSFTLIFDGSDVGLSTNAEDVDAIDVSPAGKLVVSTLGSFAVTGLSGGDEDLIEFTGSSFGATTAGSFALYIDGSDVGLTNDSEDIWGASTSSTGGVLLSTSGNHAVTGVTGDNDDIFVCTPGSTGSNTNCTFTSFWNGASFGFDAEQLDGIHVGQGFVSPAAVAVQQQAEEEQVEEDEGSNGSEDLADGDPRGEEQDTEIFLPVVTN
jgi:uncharacterized repeat protein (TIGR01451 family)